VDFTENYRSRKELLVMAIGDNVLINRRRNGGTAAMLGVTSVTLFIVGWAWDHQYAPLIFAAAPIVAIAGLISAVSVLLTPRERRSAAAFVGGAICLLVLLGYVYALLAYASGGN
jgi:hypothetical protein